MEKVEKMEARFGKAAASKHSLLPDGHRVVAEISDQRVPDQREHANLQFLITCEGHGHSLYEQDELVNNCRNEEHVPLPCERKPTS